MKKFIKSNQIIVINIAFLIGGLFLGWFGYDYYWEYKFLTLEEEEATSLELEVDYSFLEEEPSGAMLRIIEPYHCDASSNLSDSHTCKNLTDNNYSGWKDYGNSCLNESITFYFDQTYYMFADVLDNKEERTKLVNQFLSILTKREEEVLNQIRNVFNKYKLNIKENEGNDYNFGR